MNKNSQDLLKIPLDEILINNGYFLKKDKTSQRYKVLTNHNDDTIVISQQPNGHYLYFNPNEDGDRGNIYNFAQNRGVRVKDLIDEQKINQIKDLEVNNIPKNITSKINNEAVENYKKMNKIDKNSFLISKRKISGNILEQFSNLKQDNKYQNAVVPTYTIQKIGNKETLMQTGTISYLSQPIIHDPQGKPYEKPIKQLCNGSKGLEILKADTAHKNPSEFKNIIVCESMIDTLSYCEIKGISLKETLLCSTNGQISASQKEALVELQKLAPNAKFILGFDNDERGNEFGKIVEQVVLNTSKSEPVLKDFNDDLVVGKGLGISPDKISKESIAKPLKEFAKQVEYLHKKYDFLEPNAKNERVKELFRSDISKFKEIAPKIKRIQGMGECFKRLELVGKKIENDYSRAR